VPVGRDWRTLQPCEQFWHPHTIQYAVQALWHVVLEAACLLPSGVKVVLLADRGFCDTKLMSYVRSDLFSPDALPQVPTALPMAA
jgi:hypothetical protein